MTTPYEFSYLEETHSDGSVKHTYDNPLHPLDAPVYEIIEDFLTSLNTKPTTLILRDLLVEQSITINCSETDDLPSMICTILAREKSCLYFLYSIPSPNALIVGLELHRGRLSPDFIYRTEGTKIVKDK